MQQHHPSPMASAGQQPPRQQDESIDALLKWVSVKELLFVFLACSMAAVLLKNQDRLEFRVLWSQSFSNEYYENGKFPLEREKMWDCEGKSAMLIISNSITENLNKIYERMCEGMIYLNQSFRPLPKVTDLESNGLTGTQKMLGNLIVGGLKETSFLFFFSCWQT